MQKSTGKCSHWSTSSIYTQRVREHGSSESNTHNIKVGKFQGKHLGLRFCKNYLIFCFEFRKLINLPVMQVHMVKVNLHVLC